MRNCHTNAALTCPLYMMWCSGQETIKPQYTLEGPEQGLAEVLQFHYNFLR